MVATGLRARSKTLAGTALTLSTLAVATAGVAAAAGPLMSTTCSYDQLVAAVNVEAPQLGGVLAESPEAQAKLRAFLALPVAQREQRVEAALDRNPDLRNDIEHRRNTPEGQQKLATMARIADTCHDY